MLVFEEYEHVKKCGVKIYVELVGFGMSSDVYYMMLLLENGVGVVLVMVNVLCDVGIEVSQIGYVNVYGIFMLVGDKVEVQVVKIIFGEVVSCVLVSFMKFMIGYLLGVVGVVEFIYFILVLCDQVVLLIINLDNLDEGCDLDFVLYEVCQVSGMEYMLCNFFGFGGTNGFLIFKKI